MFLNGDFSAIEARGICWLAGQEDALERFRTYDRAQTVEEKYDLEPYRIMASHIYGIPTASVNKFPQRFIGKGCVLGCGYGLGPTKFRVNCAKLGYKYMPAGLEDKAVKIWRKTHPKVVAFWYELEGAAKRAIVDRGKVYAAGKHIKFQCRNEGGMNFLLMRLPSGRMISYPKPHIQADRIIHFGNIPLTQKWGDLSIWGGTLANNSCQGVCADVMTNAAHNLERSGYEICTLIHDESLVYWQQKHRDAGLTPEGFNRCMTTLPVWASGLPVASDGGVVPFYRKD